MSSPLRLSPKLTPAQMLLRAAEKERERFLMPLKIKLALAGLLVLIPRILMHPRLHLKGAGVQWFLGWPSMLIWILGGAMCAYALYQILFNRMPPALQAQEISPATLEALHDALPENVRTELALSTQGRVPTVGDLVAFANAGRA